jgi:hypothetical protein
MAKRSVVPELPTSATFSGIAGKPPNPSTIKLSPVFSKQAPKALHILTAEYESFDKRGCDITDLPSARLAIKIALIVWDLEPGILTVPQVLDLVTFISIFPTFLPFCKNCHILYNNILIYGNFYVKYLGIILSIIWSRKVMLKHRYHKLQAYQIQPYSSLTISLNSFSIIPVLDK